MTSCGEGMQVLTGAAAPPYPPAHALWKALQPLSTHTQTAGMTSAVFGGELRFQEIGGGGRGILIDLGWPFQGGRI